MYSSTKRTNSIICWNTTKRRQSSGNRRMATCSSVSHYPRQPRSANPCHIIIVSARIDTPETFILKSVPQVIKKLIPIAVCFLESREVEYLNKAEFFFSIYKRAVFLGFCLGHLVHSGLLLGYQIVFLASDGESFYECASIATLVLDFIYPIYSFLLLYFIFKYSNVSF